ncbi:AAA family ATPase [Sinorhizobium fredii]|uniref:AAA family ATPase n=1 Tax=Rhizobium fredii TaxID=380 RepID=UPI003515A52B
MDYRAPNDDGVLHFPVKLRPYALPRNLSLLPPRPWLARGLLMRRCITELIGASSIGKSSLMAGIGMHLAAGRDFGRFAVPVRCKFAFLTIEEDEDELDRRIGALAERLNFSHEDLRGHFDVIDIDRPATLAAVNRKGVLVATAKLQELELQLARKGIDVIGLDPFAELHEAEENNNGQMRAAAGFIRDMVHRIDAACLLSHHSRKGAMTPGDLDAGRGGSSLGGLVRLAFTLTQATSEMAQFLGIEDQPELWRNLVRLDQAKANHLARNAPTDWFRWQSVDLKNGEPGFSDHVGVLTPWQPPGIFEGVSVFRINQVLDRIVAGMPDGDLYSARRRSPERWAGLLLIAEFGFSDEQAKRGLAAWMESGLVYETDFIDTRGRNRNGIKVNNAKRP